MVNSKVILNALVGAAAKRMIAGSPAQGSKPGQAQSSQAQSPLVNVIDELFGAAAGRGGSADPYVQKARDFVNRNPRLAEAALTAVAGVLMGSRKSGGIAGKAVKLGGLALIGTLAYKAYQNYQAGKPLLDMGQGGGKAPEPAATAEAFDPAAATEDDALLFARAMVAAATADGRVDDNERARIAQGLSQAGIDAQATRWLEDELASPASVDDLAGPVTTPEKAAQVYAAARLAIDPDTIQEREFLRRLAESLDLDPALARQIDEAAAEVRA
jgi:uncharacterized membrane protein YebE (DUF533 family)